MKKGVLIGLFIFLCLFGVADSWYIYANEENQTALTCDITGLDGCNAVAQSQYSQVLGIPLALYGVLFYGLLFTLVASTAFTHKRLAYRSLYWLTAGGAVASFVFILIQLLIIKAICIYCFASAGASFLLLGIAFVLYRRYAPPPLAVVG
ncbi:MAG: hypothetical protein ABA06_04200 [Parcubacteria bacterium C7867-001]|nr:MAG: hypothetical protein ABA06_04200 [Parcubacteria bacterium C7867-001]